MATSEVWRTLTQCPVCLGWPHLVADSRIRTTDISALPHARMAPHSDGWNVLCYMSHRAAPVWDEPSTRAAVHGRSGGICEHCREHLATDMHHRKSRGVGGKWSPANIIHLCRLCHMFCDGNTRAEAEKINLVIGRADEPELLPVYTPFGALWLTDAVTGEPSEPQLTTDQKRRKRKAARAHRAGGRKIGGRYGTSG